MCNNNMDQENGETFTPTLIELKIDLYYRILVATLLQKMLKAYVKRCKRCSRPINNSPSLLNEFVRSATSVVIRNRVILFETRPMRKRQVIPEQWLWFDNC